MPDKKTWNLKCEVVQRCEGLLLTPRMCQVFTHDNSVSDLYSAGENTADMDVSAVMLLSLAWFRSCVATIFIIIVHITYMTLFRGLQMQNNIKQGRVHTKCIILIETLLINHVFCCRLKSHMTKTYRADRKNYETPQILHFFNGLCTLWVLS